MASTAPVRGSITTTEPSRPASASAATFCRSERMVSTTLPVLSRPPKMPWVFCAVVSPISTSLIVFSSWVLPKL